MSDRTESASRWKRAISYGCLSAPFVLAAVFWTGIQVYRVLGSFSYVVASVASIGLEEDGDFSQDVDAVANVVARRMRMSNKDKTGDERRLLAFIGAVLYQMRTDSESAIRRSEYLAADKQEADAARSILVDEFSERAAYSLAKNSAITYALGFGMVFVFALLYLLSLGRAYRRDSAKGLGRTGLRESAQKLRAKRRISEAKYHFWPRFAFSLLVGGGAIYIFAPLGIEATSMGEYANLYGPPGGLTLPFWVMNYPDASLWTVGFTGFYLYSVTTAIQRYLKDDLSDGLLVSLSVRWVVVSAMSLVLSGVMDGNSAARSLVFLVGVFPQTGLEYLQKIAQVKASSGLFSNSGAYDGVNVDMWTAASLEEAGVSNLHELAQVDPRRLIEETGIEPRLLIDVIDRAALVHEVGLESAQKLAKGLHLSRASDLLLYARGSGAFCLQHEAVGLKHYREFVGNVESQLERQLLLSKVLDANDVGPLLDRFAADLSVRYIVEAKLRYGGL